MKTKDVTRLSKIVEEAFGKRIGSRDLLGGAIIVVADGSTMVTLVTSITGSDANDPVLILGINRVVAPLMYELKKGSAAEIARLEQKDGQMKDLTKMKFRRYSFSEVQYDCRTKKWSIIAVTEPVADLMTAIGANLIVQAQSEDEGEFDSAIKEKFPGLEDTHSYVIVKNVTVEVVAS